MADRTNRDFCPPPHRLPHSGSAAFDQPWEGLGQSLLRPRGLLALFTTFNSSAVYGLGNQLKLIKVITPNINKQVFNIIQQALRPLISQGVVSLLGCTIQNNGNGNISVTVSFQDLTINNANQPIQTINVPFKQG